MAAHASCLCLNWTFSNCIVKLDLHVHSDSSWCYSHVQSVEYMPWYWHGVCVWSTTVWCQQTQWYMCSAWPIRLRFNDQWDGYWTVGEYCHALLMVASYRTWAASKQNTNMINIFHDEVSKNTIVGKHSPRSWLSWSIKHSRLKFKLIIYWHMFTNKVLITCE
jgi:hypothetical protein